MPTSHGIDYPSQSCMDSAQGADRNREESGLDEAEELVKTMLMADGACRKRGQTPEVDAGQTRRPCRARTA